MNIKHCCEEMAKHLSEGEVAVTYNDVTRSYGLAVLKEEYELPVDVDLCTIQQICYCPWCGTKLSDSLTDLINE